MSPVVEATEVSLAYRVARNKTSSIKEFAIQRLKRNITYERLWALKGVSFTLRRGEVLGVIGPNGAGKSTLMKVVARVLQPAGGRIIVRGHVGPMIELGAGFNPELTGYENIVLYGTILGRDPAEMRRRAPEIAEWAELSDFLDVPVRGYSSGMVARLGFAVATATEPDLLLVDEVLSVGDERFGQRSKQRILDMIAGGTSVIFVSHALDTVQEVADRVLWLQQGTVVQEGDPAAVIEAYRQDVQARIG